MEEVDSQLAHTRATRNGNAQAVKDLDSARAEIEAARQALEKDRADLDTAKKSTQREVSSLLTYWHVVISLTWLRLCIGW